jgi:hypothetical protein
VGNRPLEEQGEKEFDFLTFAAESYVAVSAKKKGKEKLNVPIMFRRALLLILTSDKITCYVLHNGTLYSERKLYISLEGGAR